MRPLAILFSIVFIAVTLLWGPSCANVIPPSGGPRDSLPPLLLKVTPVDSTTNFRSDRIEFQFDEYVDIQDLQNNLLFTPTFERNPEIAVRGRNITVRFLDSLESNTTYSLSFGDAVRDINENNILKGFRYTFSTGDVLDSLELSGRVILAQTGRIDTTLTVILHRSMEDSAVVNKRPPYVTRLDSRGNFSFRNLPPGTFKIYALGDAGISRRYQSKNQLFAFLDSPIVVGRQDTALTLYAYREVTPPTVAIPSIRTTGGTNRDRLTFNTNLINNQQDLLKDLEFTFPSRLKNLDSSKIRLTLDSSFIPATYTLHPDSTGRNLSIRSNWIENRQYNLILDKDFASDSLGKRLLKTDTIFFKTKKAADYARLNVKIRNIEPGMAAVLQFLQNDQVVYSAPLVNGSVSVSRFIPGEYDLRVLLDANNNGVWDRGQFFGQKRQPEIVRPIDRKITVKPNWDNEVDVSL